MLYNQYVPIANLSNRNYNAFFHYYSKPLIVNDGITFPLIYDTENLINAFFDCYSNTNKSLEMQNCLKYFNYFIFTAQKEIREHTFVPQDPYVFIEHDPKERIIYAPRFFTRVIQKALIQVVGPYLDALSIPNSTANVPERGTIFAKEIVENILENSNYVIIMDIHHYFPSIDTSILRCMLFDLIKCPSTNWLINSCIPNVPIGIPIGSITSQYLANLYLDPLDKIVYYALKNQRYCRYMDDFIVGTNTIEEANYTLGVVSSLLHNVLHLTLNKHTRILNASDEFDFVGFHYKNKKVVMTERREKLVLDAIDRFVDDGYGPEMYYYILRPIVMSFIETASRYTDDLKSIDFIINKLKLIGIDEYDIKEIKNSSAVKSAYGIKLTPFFSKKSLNRKC